jgi:fructose-1,6-bisphosphatase/inositol monophosphatase family enzyme
MDFNYLRSSAERAARAAGAIIRQNLELKPKVERKQGGSSLASQVVTAVDKAAEKAILEILKPTCEKYDLALLSEEDEDDGSRFEKDYFWCIDPLDGTLAFIEKRADFAVSIALVAQDGTSIMGVIYDPSRDILYSAVKGEGAYKNGARWQSSRKANILTYVTDHPIEKAVGSDTITAIIDQKVKELGLTGHQIISGGGLVINAMRTAENPPALMLKIPKAQKGGGSLWDYAASVCICQELGMTVRCFSEAKPLPLNKKTSSFLNQEGMYFEHLGN